MLGLKSAVTVLRHVHVNADLLRSTQLLHHDQLTGLSVRALHDKDAPGVSAHYAESQAVRSRAAWGSGSCHAEQCGRSLQVGGQGQEVEGHCLGSVEAGTAVHRAGVPLTLTAEK